jgi:diguanylate cyclase (GGDEF)-like protein
VQGGAVLAPLALGFVFHLLGKANRRLALQSAETEEIRASLSQAKSQDLLTGLGNRHRLTNELRRAIDAGETRHSPIRLYLIEIEQLDFINDTLGHHAGDELIQRAAKRIGSILQPGQTLYRMGGDEFAVVERRPGLSGRPFESAETLVGTLREGFEVEGRRITITAHAGVAETDPADDSESAVLSRADLALARSRNGAPFGVVFFSGEFADEARHRMAMEQDMQRALDRQEFYLDFQPIFGIDNGRVKGFEALARWRHPTRGIVPPAEFIPIAEQSGLILKVGSLVLRKACEEAANWPAPLTISVNVSAAQFKDKEFFGEVIASLGRSGLPAHRLVLEITESLLIENMSLVQATFDRLREIGVRFALDDFGTGYSSINHLRSLKLDHLKLDKSFADRILKDEREIEVVRSIIDLSRAFDLNTTIEGVESVQQLEMMRKQGIHSAQGFYFAKPMSADDVRSLLAIEQAGETERRTG